MPLGSNADLDFLLRDAGVPVAFGVSSTFGTLDIEDGVTTGADGIGVQTRATVLRIRRGTLAGVQVDSVITVDGEAYRVDLIEREGDGALTRLLLAEVG